METTSNIDFAEQALLASAWKRLRDCFKSAVAIFTHLLNFLFSFLVFGASVVVAVWLAMKLGIYSVTTGESNVWLMLALLSFFALVTGCYVFFDLLKKSWWQLFLICGLLALTAIFKYHWLIAVLPLIILAGAYLGVFVSRYWQSSHLQLVFSNNLKLKFFAKLVSFMATTVSTTAPLLSLLIIAQATSSMARMEFQNRPVPDLVFETADGSEWRLADHRNQKVVVIDFWATWCGPCLAAIPEMRACYERYAHREDFLLLGVAEQKDRQQVIEFCEQHDIAWPQLFLPEQPLTDGLHPDLLMHPGIPSVWVIDRNATVVGVDLRGDVVHEVIEQVMNRQ